MDDISKVTWKTLAVFYMQCFKSDNIMFQKILVPFNIFVFYAEKGEFLQRLGVLQLFKVSGALGRANVTI